MKHYRVLVNKKTYDKARWYLEELRAGRSAGKYVQEQAQNNALSFHIPVEEFLELLMRTKPPQIFAESAIAGDGSDWNQAELSILGDIGIATPVTVYDNGHHVAPALHDPPFNATLLFTPGALLRNERHCLPADWNEVTEHGRLNPKAYSMLYERRFFPLFMYANQVAAQKKTKAFITIPGLGCGQFAGKFFGQLGVELRNTLLTFLDTHGREFSNIHAVYYDPYHECSNERHEIHGISFLVRPFTKGNAQKPQLCHPRMYEEKGDHFADCAFLSCVAWDHVSWPGNDFYSGSRVTDDGVKAAATNVMAVMTGIEGTYDPRRYCYCPPMEYRTWGDVISKNSIQLEVKQNLLVFPPLKERSLMS